MSRFRLTPRQIDDNRRPYVPPHAACKHDWLDNDLDACAILGISPYQPTTWWVYEMFRQAIDGGKERRRSA